MNTPQRFLVTYGLHNFVTCAACDNKADVHPVFSIDRLGNPKLISHAKSLIEGAFGPFARIVIA